MTPTFFPTVFTIEIAGQPTLTFEAKSLREANEICNSPWLREDFSQARANGAPLWDGNAEIRVRMAYEDEIKILGEASGDVQASDGLALIYLVELDDDETNESAA